jgi:putative phage-type endonuclease
MIDRSKSLGASDAAAACGLSPWRTPYELYLEKTGEIPSQADNPRLEWGRRLEAVILEKYLTERALDPADVVTQAHRVSAEFPWMSATPDALLPDRVVEVKTAGWGKGEQWGEPGTDAIPLVYLLQITHQMIVTGLRVADVPVLIGGSDYRVYTVMFDQELADLLIDRERAFWTYVETRTPPDIKSIADSIARWPIDTGKTIVATPEVADAVYQLRVLDGEQQKLDAARDALQLAVRTCMADASVLTDTAGMVLATWKAQTRRWFQQKEFRAAHPELYAEFSEQKTTRVFLVKP